MDGPMTKTKLHSPSRADGKTRANGHAAGTLPAPSFDDPLVPSSDVPLTREEAVRQAVATVIAATPAIARAITEQAKQGNYLPAKFLFDFAGISGAPTAPAAAIDPFSALLLRHMGLLPPEAPSAISAPSAPPIVVDPLAGSPHPSPDPAPPDDERVGVVRPAAANGRVPN
jgi:hypothetical protein